MATFEDVVNKAKSAAETAGKKTSDFLEATRLKVDAAEVEKELAYTMEGLGRLLYDEKKTGEDRSTQMEDGIRRADELNARLNELRDQICRVQKAVLCHRCGAANPEDASYCKKCGERLER